jgi:hypothetical protein
LHQDEFGYKINNTLLTITITFHTILFNCLANIPIFVFLISRQKLKNK